MWFGKVSTIEEHAKALLKFCKIIPSKVNLIEYNPIDDGEFQQASDEVIEYVHGFSGTAWDHHPDQKKPRKRYRCRLRTAGQ